MAVPQPQPQLEPAQDWPEVPYKGLNFYEAKDAALFCEREEEVHSCAPLLNSRSTKMLLLHGRTGTGKSSFVRAGLYPAVLQVNRNFVVLTDETGEPSFVRSTSDPIASLTSCLHAKLKSKAQFPGLSADKRRQACSEFEDISVPSPVKKAGALRRSLETITAELIGTLVLVIDQAEEVFTLNSNKDTPVIQVYFDFLEALCTARFDIKLILTLRTEYYGQFTDRFKLQPNSKVSTVKSGLEQFMLHGIQSVQRLEAAILRPTSDQDIGHRSAPQLKYRFKFAPGLAGRIAAEVLKHCGESSALPVLQIVCLDLYSTLLPKRVLTELSHTDYQTRGGVEGAIERFIQTAIRQALATCGYVAGAAPKLSALESMNERLLRSLGWENKPAEEEAWKNVIAALVARQEGGALTSLLLAESDLLKAGTKAGIARPMKPVLAAMATEELRLLRAVTPPETAASLEISYSLGHEALAPALFQWRETRGRAIEERFQAAYRARVTLAGSMAVATALIICGAALGILASRIVKADTIHETLRAVQSTPTIRDKLLLLAGLQKKTDSLWRIILPMRDVDDGLRKILSIAPIFAESVVGGAGLSEDATTVALVDRDGSVTSAVLRPRTRPMAESDGYQVNLPSGQSPASIVAGFVKSRAVPIIVTDSTISFGAADNQRLSIKQFIGSDTATIPDFSGGVLHLTSADTSSGSLVLNIYRLAFDASASSFSVSGSTKVPIGGVLPAVYSDTSEDLAYTEGDGPFDDARQPLVKLYVTSRDNPTSKRLLAARTPHHDTNHDERLPWAITFLSDNDTLAFRDSPDSVTFVTDLSNPNGEPHLAVFSLEASNDPGRTLPPLVRSPYGRPALGAVRTRGGYRVAWLTPIGVSVLETGNDRRLTYLAHREELPVDFALQENGYSQLRFSADGNTLILIYQSGLQAAVRAWDISDIRIEQIRAMGYDQLVSTTCAVTQNLRPEARPPPDAKTRAPTGIDGVMKDLNFQQPCSP